MLNFGRKGALHAILHVVDIYTKFLRFKKYIMILHAFSSCNHVSSFLQNGKKMVWKALSLPDDDITLIFQSSTSTHEEID